MHRHRPAWIRRVARSLCFGRFLAHFKVRSRGMKLTHALSNITMECHQKKSKTFKNLTFLQIDCIETNIVLGNCRRKPSSLWHCLSWCTGGWYPKSCCEQALQWLPLGDPTNLKFPAIWWAAEIIEGRIFPHQQPNLQCLHAAAIKAHHLAESGLQICECGGNQGCCNWDHQQPQFKIQPGRMFLGGRWKDWSAIWSAWLNDVVLFFLLPFTLCLCRFQIPAGMEMVIELNHLPNASSWSPPICSKRRMWARYRSRHLSMKLWFSLLWVWFRSFSWYCFWSVQVVAGVFRIRSPHSLLKEKVCTQQHCRADHQWARWLPIFGFQRQKPVLGTSWVAPCHSNSKSNTFNNRKCCCHPNNFPLFINVFWCFLFRLEVFLRSWGMARRCSYWAPFSMLNWKISIMKNTHWQHTDKCSCGVQLVQGCKWCDVWCFWTMDVVCGIPWNRGLPRKTWAPRASSATALHREHYGSSSSFDGFGGCWWGGLEGSKSKASHLLQSFFQKKIPIDAIVFKFHHEWYFVNPLDEKMILPDTWQMKIKVAYHTMDGNNFTSTKSLAFVLDAVKDDDPGTESGKKKKKKDKKENKNGVTHKNFGAGLSMDKMKGTNRFHIGWRVRLLC